VRAAALVTLGWLAAASLVVAQQSARAPLQVEPLGGSGESVYPVYEGWGPHKDGSTVILLGYFNRNRTQAVDIPIGPNNRIEPGGPDQGQPTHFEAGQQHGVFAIRVPKDFGSQKLTWTLTVNGQTTSVSFWLNPPYFLDFFRNAATENEPPVVRLTENGPPLTGPPLGVAHTLSGTVKQPVALRLWASDVPEGRPGADDELADQRSKRPTVVEPFAIVGDQSFGGIKGGRPRAARPDIIVSWKMHRGPGRVSVAQPRIPLITKGDSKVVVQASTTATFDTPGEYVMRAQVNDESGEGGSGDQCCWTTALVRVNVQ
jgi:hypothetical protein